MILQALVRYYDILASDPESGIAKLGYSSAGVRFVLNLSRQGDLLDIFHIFEKDQRGKSTIEVPRQMLVPEQVKRSSGVAANFLCDNSTYVLGLSTRGADDRGYALKRHEEFRALNKMLLEKAQCPAARAVLAFLDRYDPKKGKENPIIARHLEELLEGGNLVFQLEGGVYVHEDAEVRRVWVAYKAETASLDVGQCLVTGEIGPIARLHPSLKRIAGANPTGATLVGFNASAYESYHRVQGLNSPVSEKATFAYGTALNYLLSPENKNRKFKLGDTTVVYWAESANKAYAERFAGLFDPAWNEEEEEPPGATGRDKKAEKRLGDLAQKVKRLEAIDAQKIMEGLDPKTSFYVLGLAPNMSRIVVRFFHAEPFEKIVQKIMAHYEDLQVIKEYDNQPTHISVWQILNETVSQKSSDKQASPLMAGAVVRSILEDAPYPAALYYAIINRIRADMDDEKRRIRKINYIRAAVIKAYLTRKYRHQNQPKFQEVLCMSLNEQSTNPAYLLGRLFAVLEKAQRDAIGNLDATIKDRYFTSACASPASVFPVLLRLAQHHIAKAEYGYHSERLIEEIMGHLDVEHNPIPAHLSLDEQGIFILGYYHQRADFFVKNSHPNVEES